MIENPPCPSCGARSVKAGKRATGRQIYGCTNCSRRFTGYPSGGVCIGDRPLTARQRYQKFAAKKKLAEGVDKQTRVSDNNCIETNNRTND